MSQKYFIVSEQELVNLIKTHAQLDYESFLNSEEIEDFIATADRAMDVCLSRPAPEWATHFAGNTLNTGPDVTTWNFEEIKK